MNGVEGDDRIEIELTPSAPRHPPSRPPDPDPEGEASASDLAARLRDGAARGRVAALVVGVGLGALFLGWILGRSGSEDAAADAPATSEVAADERSDDREGEDESAVLPTIRTVPPTTTERPRRTTTTLPPAETTVIEVAPQLAGLPFDLVGTRSNPAGSLVTLDLASGTMTERRDVDLDPLNGGPSTLFAGPGWVLVPDWDSESHATLIEVGADPVTVDLGPPWQLVESATPGQFWRADGQHMIGLSRAAELVDRYGEPIGPSLELPYRQSLAFADPLGGLVVNTPSGAYLVNPDGASQIVDGTVISIGSDRAFAHRCDEQFICGYVVVDRDSGDVRPIELEEELLDVSPYVWGGGGTTTIAPNGRTAATNWVDPSHGSPRLGLIDLETGGVTRLSTAGDAALEWSPDGRFAFFLEVGLPMAHDLTTGESFVIADDLPRLNGIDLRPSSSEPPAG